MEGFVCKFLEKEGTRKHVLLVHNDTRQAKKIQFEFIKNGLVKNESCIFLIDHDKKIKHVKNEMKENGIDVKYYESKNRLRIYQIPQFDKDSDGIWLGFKKWSDKILGESIAPFRIVGRIISDTSNEVSMSVQMVIEKNIHAVFDGLDASVLCHYDTREFPEKNCINVIANLCKSHHLIIEIDGNNESVRHLP